MFGIDDVSKLMRRKKRGSMGKKMMWFALGTAVGVGMSRMRNQRQHVEHWIEDESQGPMEVDI